MKRARFVVATLVLAFLIGLAIRMFPRERRDLKPIEELKVRISSSVSLPDPAHIESAGDWYILDHVSGGLASFDTEKKKFEPLYAESWHTKADGTHIFRLRPDIHFHDGTPITPKDILWTIKRQLLLKSSTHFPLWEYIAGGDHLKSLDEECIGLSAKNSEITFRLKKQTESFFLQLASPETGIWSASDMDPKTGKLTPTKFSGPYAFSEAAQDFALLKRNEYSPISQAFPNSPRAIRVKRVPLGEVDQALLKHELDLVIRPHRPMGEPNWAEQGIGVRSTTPSSIVYLYGLWRGNHPAIGRDFISSAWSTNSDPEVYNAETYLPFVKGYSLTKDDFLAQLPEKSARKLRVFCPQGFFSESFLKHLQTVALSAGTEIEYSFAPSAEWFAAFDDPKASDKYDYILSAYAASERYPAVQLRYLTGSLNKAPIDLKETESPDLDPDRISILKEYQRWLLKSGQATPLYFVATLFLHQKNIDLGDQPSNDAEIELWRVQRAK
jgi:hypothetical protein